MFLRCHACGGRSTHIPQAEQWDGRIGIRLPAVGSLMLVWIYRADEADKRAGNQGLPARLWHCR